MRAVVYEGVKEVRVGDVPDPRIEDAHDAVVRVTTAAICGSDLHFYGGKAPLAPAETTGHEAAGPVGFFCAQAARVHGAGQVLVLALEADRLALAEKVGATPIDVRERNPQMAVARATEGRGADVVIEAVGNPSAFETAVEVVRR